MRGGAAVAVAMFALVACDSGSYGAQRGPAPGCASSRPAEFKVTPDPPTPRAGQPTTLHITGAACGGRHLRVTTFSWHERGGSGGAGPPLISCHKDANQGRALPDDPVSVTHPHGWRHRGTHKVTLTLEAPCRPDIPPHTVTEVFTVQ